MTITPEYLKDCLEYDPETGVFTWKFRPREHFKTERGWKIFNTTYAGKAVGCPTASGYLQIVVSRKETRGKHLLAHRVAWLFVHGVWPAEHVDHINRNPSDNRISNLREATNSENTKNAGILRRNTSGVKGVCWAKNAKKWKAEIQSNKKRFHLGLYISKADAENAVRTARIRLHGDFANHGDSPDPVFE